MGRSPYAHRRRGKVGTDFSFATSLQGLWNPSRLAYLFFQAEDGIRDLTVTGVQTCALPISLGPVEDRHLPEAGARLEDGQRFLSRPGDRAGDANLAFGDNEEPVAGLAFLEHLLADGELLLPADLGHAGQLAVVQVLEDRRLLQQIEVHADEGMTHRREGQVKIGRASCRERV